MPRLRRAGWSAASFGLPPLLFATPYVLLLVWFHGVDVYHQHFSEPGLIVLAYNFFRVLFIFYLFWMVETAGLLLLRAIARNAIEKIGVLERLALGFFTGAGVWQVAMLALGYLDLYTLPVAIVITLPLVVMSYADARAAAGDIRRAITTGDALARNLGPGMLGWLLLALGSLALIMLLLVKGLYPGGGHDYFTHYFYYFQTVIDRGGLWPNDVWYHYYYDKGAGLFFIGILITDLLAPQLVTFCFMAAATLALFLLLRRIAPGTLWPLVGVVLFLSLYIYTPGAAILYRNNGGWADFEKLHEINAALVITVLWTTVETLSFTNRMRILWLVGAAASIICAIIANITIAVFFCGVFALLAVFFAVFRRYAQVLVCLGLGAVAGLAFVTMLAINALTTGLASDQGILFFWNFANIENLESWGALPLVIILHHDFQRMVAAAAPLSIHTVIFLIESSRLELVAPLVIGGMIVAAAALPRGRWNRSLETVTAVTAAVGLTFIAFALLVGRAQQVSFYRYASFATAPAIVCGVLGWNLIRAENRISRMARYRPIAVLVLLLCAVSSVYPRLTLSALNRALQFATGRYSIDAAYSRQYGPPPRGEWSAIYPGSRGAYEVVGPNTRIWSLHIHLYCMLPDCRVETYPAFIMTPGWDRLMFGMPKEARQVLQAAHLNYFLYTREDGISDPLPLSPLFAPDTIGRYLGIRWTDGTSYLLTWLGPGVQPLDQAWLADYRSAVEQSGIVAGFPYEEMKQIFARLRATPHPWRAFPLPWQRN